MKIQTYKKAAFGLSLAGVLFSGYLSGIKLFNNTCAFNESCPYFLGYPSCYYGFTLFLILFITSLLLLVDKAGFRKSARLNLFVSGLGILFAGYFAYPEVVGLIDNTLPSRFLGLSTCVYGLIFFVLVFIISALSLRNRGIINK